MTAVQPSDPDRMLAEAVAAADLGELSESRHLAEQVLAARPGDAEAEALLVLSPNRSDQLRRLTMMFVDLKDSSRLSEALGPEGHRSYMGAYEHAVRSITEDRHQGRVVQFSGDGALILFGHPVPREGDTGRAVTAGLELAARIADLGADITARFGQGMTARIAVHHGLVYLEYGTGRIYGPAPNLVSRLQDLAGDNEVLVSAVVKDMVADRFTFVDHEPAMVKGFALPCRFATVRGPTSRARVPAADWKPHDVFVGRSTELEQLTRQVDPTAGGGVATVVVGEAGIGKSRMIDEVARRLGAEGVRSLRAPADRLHRFTLLGPIRSAFEVELGMTDMVWPSARLGRLRQWLADDDDDLPLLALMLGIPPGDYQPPELDARRLYRQVLEATGAALRRLSAGQPTLLLLDDVHLADPATTQLLASLLDDPNEAMVPLATARPQTVSGWPAVLELGPIDDGAGRVLAAAWAGSDVDDGELDAVVDRADGVPLYIRELSRHRGAGSPDGFGGGGRHADDSTVPDVLYEPLLAALYRDPERIDLVQLAATMGAVVDVDVLADVLDVTPRAVEAHLAALVERGILDITGSSRTLRFHHALARNLAYELQPREVAAARHGRIGEELRRRAAAGAGSQGRWAEVADHFDRAARPSDAVPAYGEAASELRSAGALSDARTLLDRAIELARTELGDPVTEVDLLLRRTYLTISLEGFAAPGAVADLERCTGLTDRSDHEAQRISVLTSTWAFRGARGELALQRSITDELARLSADSPGLSAQNMAGFGMVDFFEGQQESAHTHLDRSIRSLRTAPPVGADSAGWHIPNSPEVSALTHAGVTAWLTGNGDGSAQFGRAADLAAGEAFPSSVFGRCYLLTYQGWVAVEDGRFDDADAVLSELATLAERHGFEFWLVTSTIHQTVARARRLLLGDDPGAEELRVVAGEIGQWTMLWTMMNTRVFEPYPLTWQAAGLAAAGDVEESIAVYRTIDDMVALLGNAFYRAETLRTRGVYLGDLASIRAALAVAVDQRALPFALRAGVDLARLTGDLEPLASVVGGLPATIVCREMDLARSMLAP